MVIVLSDEEAEITPLTFHEVVEVLEKLSKSEGTFRRSTHRRVYEYAQKFLFTTKEEILDIIGKIEKLGVPRNIAIQIAYLLPSTPEEVRPFLSQIRQSGVKIEDEEKLTSAIVEITLPVWRSKYSKIMALRNISVAEIKKKAEEKGG